MPALVSQIGNARMAPHKGAHAAQPFPPAPGGAFHEPPRALDASVHSHIATWASHVAPGEPAPQSPRKPHVPHEARPKHHSSKHAPPPAPLTPPIAPAADASADLARLGYTSFFVDLPRRERTRHDSTACPATATASASDSESSSTPTVTKKSAFAKTFKAFSKTMPRLDALRFQSTPALVGEPVEEKAPSSSKPKRFPVGKQPAPMENELALMQFLGGGKVEKHARDVMRQQAPRSRRTSTGGGVRTAYRDANGQHWLDRDEALEYRGLLADDAHGKENGHRRRGSVSAEEGQAHSSKAARGREGRRPPPLHLAHPDRLNRPSRRADSAHAARHEFSDSFNPAPPLSAALPSRREPSKARPASSKGRSLVPGFLTRKA
ncbi:hypothetical protein HDZ31DRAFT_68680 [Schizophyllum fasciatum]